MRRVGVIAATATLIAAFTFPAGASSEGDVVNPSILSEFSGVLPDGTFKFGVLVDPSAEKADTLGGALTPGWVVTFVHLVRPSEVVRVEGPVQIVEVLQRLKLGDRVGVKLLNPVTGEEVERDVVIRSAQRVVADVQIEDARSSAVFGDSVIGLRLKLFADGSFEALDELIIQDAKGAVGELGAFAELVGALVPSFEENYVNSRYAGLISMYGIARLALHGTCGEVVDPISTTVTRWTEYRNGFGTVTGTSDPVKSEGKGFLVPDGFGPIVASSNMGQVPSVAAPYIKSIVLRLTCDNKARYRLERNMVAFWKGDAPAFRKD